MSDEEMEEELFALFKVSARVQDRPRADRCRAFISCINPDKPTFPESLIVPDYGSFL